MKTTAIGRRAELLDVYTAMPWQSDLRRVKSTAPGSPLIPQPAPDQMLLEARVMRALIGLRVDPLHPWGIEYVDPRADRLKLRFATDLPEKHILGLAEELLPRADAYGEVKGPAGARMHVDGDTVVLRVLGTAASVTLLGLDPDAWLHAVDLQDRNLSAEGLTLCHREETRLHPAEQPYLRQGRTEGSVSAWLASGLLRRTGLFRTLGGGASQDHRPDRPLLRARGRRALDHPMHLRGGIRRPRPPTADVPAHGTRLGHAPHRAGQTLHVRSAARKQR
ncbi:hypothetical protein [Streptomyces fagopyri]